MKLKLASDAIGVASHALFGIDGACSHSYTFSQPVADPVGPTSRLTFGHLALHPLGWLMSIRETLRRPVESPKQGNNWRPRPKTLVGKLARATGSATGFFVPNDPSSATAADSAAASVKKGNELP